MSYIKKIISPSEVKTATERTHDFSYRDHTPGGFAFPCDKDGEPLETDKFHNNWRKNYEYCLAHPEIFVDDGVVETFWEYVEPAHAVCSCGEEIYLSRDTQCACGQWYNGFGQALRDPFEWYDDYGDHAECG